MSTRLITVRHGETSLNLQKRYQSNLDSPLTDKGIQQVEQAASALAEIPIHAVYTSPQPRTIHTASIICQKRKYDITPDTRLSEIDCGIWDGRYFSDIRRLYPEEISLWETCPHMHTMPGGENLNQVRTRIISFTREIVKKHEDETILIVSHMIPIMLIKMIFENKPDELLWDIQKPDNAEINIINIDAD